MKKEAMPIAFTFFSQRLKKHQKYYGMALELS